MCEFTFRKELRCLRSTQFYCLSIRVFRLLHQHLRTGKKLDEIRNGALAPAFSSCQSEILTEGLSARGRRPVAKTEIGNGRATSIKEEEKIATL